MVSVVDNISFEDKFKRTPHVLSALIGADTFFYGTFDSKFKLCSAKSFTDVDFSDQQIVADLIADIKENKASKIKIASTTKPYIHTPHGNLNLANYFPAFENKDLEVESLTAQEVEVIYGVSKLVGKFINKISDELEVFHLSTVLANEVYPSTKPTLSAHIENGILHVLHSDVDNFKYYNQFTCLNENDYLYFILLAFKELGLKPEEHRLFLSGRVDKLSPIYQLIQNYIRDVEIANPYLLSIADNGPQKPHYYYDLYATAICGS